MLKNILTLPQTLRIIFILVYLLVMGCCPNVDQNLNSKIRTWAPYKTSQDVIFRSADSDSIVFKVVNQNNRTEAGHDKVCGRYDIETVETLLINQADTSFQFKITLTQEVVVKLESYQTQPAAKNLSAMFNSVSEQYISDDWRDQYLAEVSLNGITYNNILHVYANLPLSGYSFLEIFYAQHEGLIAFSNINGVWYYRE